MPQQREQITSIEATGEVHKRFQISVQLKTSVHNEINEISAIFRYYQLTYVYYILHFRQHESNSW